MRVKTRKIRRILAAVLAAATLLCASGCGGGGRESEIFDFINCYETPVTQPGLGQKELEKLSDCGLDCERSMEYSKFSAQELAYDGNLAYLLVRVTPKDGVLLISTFGRDPDEAIPDGDGESFNQRAQREGKSLVYVGLSVDIGDEAKGLNPSASLDDRYCADGSVLLFARYSFTEPTDAQRQFEVILNEIPDGAKEGKSDVISFSHAPTAELETKQLPQDLSAKFGRVTGVELRRSALGMSAVVSGELLPSLSEAEMQALFSQTMNLYAGGAELSCIESYMLLFDADGTLVSPENPVGAVSFVFIEQLCAGEKMPESVSIEIFDFVNSVPVEPSDKPTGKIPAAFTEALIAMLDDELWPDGAAVGVDPLEIAFFTIYDIDADGKPELIIRLETETVAACVEKVYSYNEESGKLELELSVYPQTIYYPNGVVLEQWSHNQGLAPTKFWPYTMYKYNAKTDKYETVAAVDAWEKAAFAKDGEGNAFPDDIDAQGAGIVYMITSGGETDILGKSDYEAWCAKNIGEQSELVLSYSALSRDTIAEETKG